MPNVDTSNIARAPNGRRHGKGSDSDDDDDWSSWEAAKSFTTSFRNSAPGTSLMNRKMENNDGSSSENDGDVFEQYTATSHSDMQEWDMPHVDENLQTSCKSPQKVKSKRGQKKNRSLDGFVAKHRTLPVAGRGTLLREMEMKDVSFTDYCAKQDLKQANINVGDPDTDILKMAANHFNRNPNFDLNEPCFESLIPSSAARVPDQFDDADEGHDCCSDDDDCKDSADTQSSKQFPQNPSLHLLPPHAPPYHQNFADFLFNLDDRLFEQPDVFGRLLESFCAWKSEAIHYNQLKETLTEILLGNYPDLVEKFLDFCSAFEVSQLDASAENRDGGQEECSGLVNASEQTQQTGYPAEGCVMGGSKERSMSEVHGTYAVDGCNAALDCLSLRPDMTEHPTSVEPAGPGCFSLPTSAEPKTCLGAPEEPTLLIAHDGCEYLQVASDESPETQSVLVHEPAQPDERPGSRPLPAVNGSQLPLLTVDTSMDIQRLCEQLRLTAEQETIDKYLEFIYSLDSEPEPCQSDESVSSQALDLLMDWKTQKIDYFQLRHEMVQLFGECFPDLLNDILNFIEAFESSHPLLQVLSPPRFVIESSIESSECSLVSPNGAEESLQCPEESSESQLPPVNSEEQPSNVFNFRGPEVATELPRIAPLADGQPQAKPRRKCRNVVLLQFLNKEAEENEKKNKHIVIDS